MSNPDDLGLSERWINLVFFYLSWLLGTCIFALGLGFVTGAHWGPAQAAKEQEIQMKFLKENIATKRVNDATERRRYLEHSLDAMKRENRDLAVAANAAKQHFQVMVDINEKLRGKVSVLEDKEDRSSARARRALESENENLRTMNARYRRVDFDYNETFYEGVFSVVTSQHKKMNRTTKDRKIVALRRSACTSNRSMPESRRQRRRFEEMASRLESQERTITEKSREFTSQAAMVENMAHDAQIREDKHKAKILKLQETYRGVTRQLEGNYQNELARAQETLKDKSLTHTAQEAELGRFRSKIAECERVVTDYDKQITQAQEASNALNNQLQQIKLEKAQATERMRLQDKEIHCFRNDLQLAQNELETFRQNRHPTLQAHVQEACDRAKRELEDEIRRKVSCEIMGSMRDELEQKYRDEIAMSNQKLQASHGQIGEMQRSMQSETDRKEQREKRITQLEKHLETQEFNLKQRETRLQAEIQGAAGSTPMDHESATGDRILELERQANLHRKQVVRAQGMLRKAEQETKEAREKLEKANHDHAEEIAKERRSTNKMLQGKIDVLQQQLRDALRTNGN